MKKLKLLTEKEELEIVEKRKNGILTNFIKIEYGISDRHFYSILKKYNIEIKHKVKKYNFNEDYFENIDTEDKAYFLGFIIADGCVQSYGKNIALIITQKEPDILYDIIKYIDFDGKPWKSNKRNIFSLTLSSPKIVNDLKNKGVVDNKTMIVKYPIIPDNLQNHFMRGVFDGDGCISIHHDKRDNSDRGQVNICSGSIDFIQKYVDNMVLLANVKRNNIRCPKNTYHVIDWGGLTDIENIYNFLYKDATVFLKRKKETFDKVMIIHSNKNKYRKK
jgi:hypothetical protein